MEGASKPSKPVQWAEVSLPLQVELFENLATAYGKRNQLPQEFIRHLLTRCTGFERARGRLRMSPEEFTQICQHVQQRKKQEILEDAGVKDLQEAQLNMMLSYDHSLPLKFDPFLTYHALTERCWSHFKDEGYFTCEAEDVDTVARYLLEHGVHPSMAGEWVLNTRYSRDPTAVGGHDRNSSMLPQNATAGTSHPPANLENEALLSSEEIAALNTVKQKDRQTIAQPSTSPQITQRGGDIQLSGNEFGKERGAPANEASSPSRPRLLIRLSLGIPSQSPEQSASPHRRSFTPAFEVSQNGRAVVRSLEDKQEGSTQQPLYSPQTPSRQISTPWTPERGTFPRKASPKLPVQRQLVDSRLRGDFDDFESRLLGINSAVAGNTPYSTFQPQSLSSPTRRVGNANLLSIAASHAIQSGPSQGGTLAEETDTLETRKRKRSLAAQVSPAYSPITLLADNMGEPAEVSPVELPSPPRVTGFHQGWMTAAHAPTSSTLVGTSSPRKGDQSSPGQQLTQSLANSLANSQPSGYVDQASASPQALTPGLLKQINDVLASSQHRRGSHTEPDLGEASASAKNVSAPKPDGGEDEPSRSQVSTEAAANTTGMSTVVSPTRTPISSTITPRKQTKRAVAVEKWPNGQEYKHGPQTRTLKKWKEEGRISDEVYAASLPAYPRPTGGKPVDENALANESSQFANDVVDKLSWWGSSKALEELVQQGQQHDSALRNMESRTTQIPEQSGHTAGNLVTPSKQITEPNAVSAQPVMATFTETPVHNVQIGAANDRDSQNLPKTAENGFQTSHPGPLAHVSANSSEDDQTSPNPAAKRRRKHRKKSPAAQQLTPDGAMVATGQGISQLDGKKTHKRQLSGQTDGSNEEADTSGVSRTSPGMASAGKQKKRPSPKKAKHGPPSTEMRRTGESSMNDLTANMPPLPPPVRKEPTKDRRRFSQGSKPTKNNSPGLVYRKKPSFHGNGFVRADGTPRNSTPLTEEDLQPISTEPTEKLISQDTQGVKNSSRKGKAVKAAAPGNSRPVLSAQRITTPEPAPQASLESPSKSPFRGNQFRNPDGTPRTTPQTPVASPGSQRFNGNQWTNADGSPRHSRVSPTKKSASTTQTRKNSVSVTQTRKNSASGTQNRKNIPSGTQTRKKTPGRTPSSSKGTSATTTKKSASTTKAASVKKTSSPKKSASPAVPVTPARATQTSTSTTPGSKKFQGNQYYHADGTPKTDYVGPDGKRAQKERANIRS